MSNHKAQMKERILHILNTKELLARLKPRNIKNENEKEYSEHFYREFYFKVLYLYHKTHNLQTLLDKMLQDGLINHPIHFECDKEISFYGFVNKLNGFRNITSKAPKYHNQYQIIKKGATKYIFGGESTLQCINSDLLIRTENDKKEAELTKHIFLNLNVNDLHHFASRLLDKYTENNRIPNFKIRIENTEAEQKAPFNLVVYFSEENFTEHIKIIQEIHQEMLKENFTIRTKESITPGYQCDIAPNKDRECIISIGEDISPNVNSYPSAIDIFFQTAFTQRPNATKEEQASIITDTIYSQYGNLFEFCDKQLATILNKTQQPAQAQNNIKQTSNPQLISQYLQQFIDPQILEQLTSNPPRR